MGAEPWRLVVAAGFVLALAVGVVVVAISGGGDPATPTAGAAAPTAPTLPTTAIVTSSSAPTSTIAPSVAPTSPPLAAPPPEEVSDRDVFAAAQRALTAWGEFAVTGDLALVADTFDLDGPQYAQLAAEAPSLAADPLGPPSYVFAMGTPEIERPRPKRIILTGPVVLSRPGEPDQRFTWDLHLRWSGVDWRLWTVNEIEPKE